MGIESYDFSAYLSVPHSNNVEDKAHIYLYVDSREQSS